MLEETKPWDSKLGECPYLKNSEDYPTDEDGNPMLFLAQINLVDLENLEELPEKGLLQFFVANDDLFGLEDSIHVKHIEDYEENEEDLVKKHPYENEEYKSNLPFLHKGKMHFTSREMPMSSSLDLFRETFMNKLSEVEYEKLSDVFKPVIIPLYPSWNNMRGIVCFPVYLENKEPNPLKN